MLEVLFTQGTTSFHLTDIILGKEIHNDETHHKFSRLKYCDGKNKIRRAISRA